jgi:hypothetical protein
MSGFNGSGTFTISEIGVPYVSGQPILALPANNINSAIATGLSTCILKDGTQASVSANIPFNNFKLTYVGAGTAFNDAANIYNLQLSTGSLLTVTGTDTLTGNATPTLTSGYATGMTFRFFAAANNTGAVTINIDGLGAKSITRNGSSALGAGDIYTGNLITITYNGTAFVLQNAVTYDASGNVGIGTSSPSTYGKLAVQTSGGAVNGLGIYSPSTTNGAKIVLYDSYSNAGISSVPVSATTSSDLSFIAGGAEKMRLDSSGNLGLGVTPSAWATRAFDLGTYASFSSISGADISLNAYYNGGWKYKTTGAASWYSAQFGQHTWNVAPSGTAGNAITFTQAMTLDASGNLGIGTSSPNAPLSFANIVGRKIDLYYGGVGNEFALGVQSSELRIATGASPAIISFYTGGYSGTERMRLDASGNLKFNSGYGSVATAYGCRAWVNFNGNTGTIPSGSSTIRGSGNVSSVTHLADGRWAINFTTAMPDANYAPSCTAKSKGQTGTAYDGTLAVDKTATSTASILYVQYVACGTNAGYSGGMENLDYAYVAVFR